MKITDEKLFRFCREYGAQALEWRRRFVGLLPEVARREQAARVIGESWLGRRGYTSIFEFAAKLGGVSEEQVRLALNLEKRFEDKPALHRALVSGVVSVAKLARVVSIATVENQEELAEQIQILSKSALETWVRDVKSANVDAVQKPIFGAESLPGRTLNFKFDEDVVAELNDLQAKGIDVNQLMRDMLEARRIRIAAEKENLALEPEESAVNCGQSDGRYVPVRVKRVLRAEFGGKCSIPRCSRPAAVIHHTRRFALTGSHDPRYLAPLCREHHQIAHCVDRKFLRSKNKRITAMASGLLPPDRD